MAKENWIDSTHKNDMKILPVFFINSDLPFSKIRVGFCHIFCCCLLYSLNSQMGMNGSTEKGNRLSPPENQRQNFLHISHSSPGTTCSSSLISGSPESGACYPLSFHRWHAWSSLGSWVGWVGLGCLWGFFKGKKGLQNVWGVVTLWFGIFCLFASLFFQLALSGIGDELHNLFSRIFVSEENDFTTFVVVISSTRFKP